MTRSRRLPLRTVLQDDSRGWLYALFGAGIAILIAVILIDGGTPRSAAQSVRAETSVTAAVPATGNSESGGGGEPAPEPALPATDLAPLRQSLNAAAKAFEEAYFTYGYTDTADTRILRVRPFTTEGFAAELYRNFMAGGSAADQLFTREQLSSVATVNESDLIGKLYPSTEPTGPLRGCVDTQVIVSTLDASGVIRPPGGVPVAISRYYVIQQGKWLAAGTVPYGSTCPERKE